MAYLYDQGSSLFFTYLKAMEIFFVVSAFTTAWNESQLKFNMPYSKFINPSKEKFQKVSSRRGMLVGYMPALVISCLLFAATIRLNDGKQEDCSTKLLVLTAAFVAHFLKRVLEVIFVHRYSGEMSLGLSIVMSAGYSMFVVNLYFAQRASQQLKPPSVDLTWVGVAAFCIGNAGNFYHHFLLRGLRKEGNKKYEIPRGGLFDVFVAPHYVFETLTFAGISLIAQTVYAVFLVFYMTFYLTSRSYATKRWYMHKVDGYPNDKYALIPYLL